MNRKERRAVEHKARKLARRAGFPTIEPTQSEAPTATPAASTAAVSPAPRIVEIPEPGFPFPSLSSLTPEQPVISEARLSANRANAKHSTGPRTEIGLATSSQNRTTHGLARHNGTFTLLPTEDPTGFEALKDALAQEHAPSTETESILVMTMAISHWLANRAENLQSRCFDPQTGQISDTKTFSLYLRYQSTHTRAFYKSLHDLAKLKSEKRKQAETIIKEEKHEMKKQTHYWDVLRKDGEACSRITQNVMQNYKAAEENPGFEAQYAAELAKRGLEQHPLWRGAAQAAA